jgi:TonB family protein
VRALGHPIPAARHGGVMLVIVIAHLMLIWALTHSLQGAPLRTPPSILSTFIDTPPRRPPEPPLPVLRIDARATQAAPAQVPMPLVHIERPPDTSVSAGIPSGKDTGNGNAALGTRVRHEPALVFAPDTAGFYPLASLEYHEQGNVLVSVCLDAQAQITRVEVLRSSHISRLDAAAVRVAGKTRWKTATLGDTPIAVCAPMNVEFKDVNAPKSW